MTAKRNLLLLPTIIAILLFALLAGDASAATTWKADSGMNAATDYGKGAQYVVRQVKRKCGGEIQVKTFRAGNWGNWTNLSCTQTKANRFATPTVTVDRATNRVYVVWMRASVFNSEKKASVLVRVSANQGRTWASARKLVSIPKNQLNQGVSASADHGVLWLGWQEMHVIGDQHPTLYFAPFNAATGAQLHDPLISVPSDNKGRGTLRVLAGKGRATIFWRNAAGGVGSTQNRWYAAVTRPVDGISGAKHAGIAKQGRIAPVRVADLIRGDDGNVYEMVEDQNFISNQAVVSDEKWDPSTLAFTTASSVTVPANLYAGVDVAIGAAKDGTTYIAYLDFGDGPGSRDDKCWGLPDGIASCTLTTAPTPAPTILYVQSFSPTGAPESNVGVPLPFASWAPNGEQIAEYVDRGTGTEAITALVTGRPSISFVAAWQDAASAGDPTASSNLFGIFSGPLY